MPLPTAELTFDRPTGYVVPMIRAVMVEVERDGRPRDKAPEIAVLSDCYQQFAHEGLQRLVLDIACTAAEATTMLAEMSPLNQIEILQALSAHTSVEAAFERSSGNGAPAWGYIPSMLRPIFQPETRPAMDEVLFEIDEKYGFAASMDFIIALANYTGAVIHHMRQLSSRAVEDIVQLLEGRAKAAWAELDTYDTRGYMNR